MFLQELLHRYEHAFAARPGTAMKTVPRLRDGYKSCSKTDGIETLSSKAPIGNDASHPYRDKTGA